MSDPTVIYAERLISTVARAFYEDDAICLIDILLRDKYLRNDEMGHRLSLRPKQLRKTLNFLQQEHIVKYEELSILTPSGKRSSKRTTKFWYIDYNQAVNTIRLRITLIRKQLEKEEHEARNTSIYVCPGYNSNYCNGRYTEQEVLQSLTDPSSNLFLCPQCKLAHENNIDLNLPPKSTYTLELLDKTQAILEAEERKRRFDIQMSAKTIGYEQLRPSIYDLLKKVRRIGTIITSNLASENLKGIGAKKIDFEVKEGESERAHLLATTGRGQKRTIMDVAACRIATSLPIEFELISMQRQKRVKIEGDRKNQIKKAKELSLLVNIIGRSGSERVIMSEEEDEKIEVENDEKNPSEKGVVPFVYHEMEELLCMTESERIAAFQKQYEKEMANQSTLFPSEPDEEFERIDETEDAVMWEDG